MIRLRVLVGRRVREIRKERGLTQAKLAEMADVSHVTIGYYERGVKFPSAETLEKLAAALAVRVEDLFKESAADYLSDDRREAFKGLVHSLRHDSPEYIRTVGKLVDELKKGKS